MKSKHFELTDESPAGTCFQEYVTASYLELFELFGSPNSKGDEYKVSTEWDLVLKNEGAIITIYDWKTTVLYDPGGISVDELRRLPEYEWHIGAKSSLSGLTAKEYIKKELEVIRGK